MEKTIRFAFYLFLVTGLLFTACSTEDRDDSDDLGGSLEESLEIEDEDEGEDEEDDDEEDANTNTSSTSGSSKGDTSGSTEEASYKDGTYTQTGSYSTPAGTEQIGVTLTLEAGVVTSVSINNTAKDDVSIGFVKLFSEGISSVVVGKPIESISNVGAVNGSSLTPNGFGSAVEAIMAEASA